MKKIIYIFSLIILVAGVSGCMLKAPGKEELMKYMEEKYGEEFEFVNINTQTWSAGYVEMKVKSKQFPDYTITVRKSKEKGIISDNYVDFLMKEPIEQELNTILAQVYENYKVFYIPGGIPLPNEASPDMSVSEYSKIRTLPLTIQIGVFDENLSSKDELVEKLRILLEAKQYKSEVYVFYMLDGKLSELNDSNRNELFNDSTDHNWAVIRGHFLMDKNFQFLSSKWRELN